MSGQSARKSTPKTALKTEVHSKPKHKASKQRVRKSTPKTMIKQSIDKTGPFRISLIKVGNFKNFKKAQIELNKFNVIVGKNASGKSNLFQIFVFLKDIAQRGLANAIAYQGGSRFINNFSSRSSKLEMEIHFSSEFPHELSGLHPYDPNSKDTRKYLDTKHMIYSFAVKLQKNGDYKILKDTLEIRCSVRQRHHDDAELQGRIIFSKKGAKIKPKYDFPPDAKSASWQKSDFFEYYPLTSKQLLMESRILVYIINGWREFLEGIELYNLDPAMLKKPSDGRAPLKLEYDGSNLAAVLYNIKNTPKLYEMFQEFVGDTLDFYKSFSAERNSDGMSIFNLDEKNKKGIPPAFASDGTVNIFAIIICLFLQGNHLTIIEEPERNIHPGLLARMISYMEDASRINQIIMSTHDPRVLDHVKIDAISFVIRNEAGSSTVVKPENHKAVQQFSKYMQMSEMMIQNMLDEENA